VEIQLVRLLASFRRVKEEELKLLLTPPHIDPTPSEIFEVLHGTRHRDGDSQRGGWAS